MNEQWIVKLKDNFITTFGHYMKKKKENLKTGNSKIFAQLIFTCLKSISSVSSVDFEQVNVSWGVIEFSLTCLKIDTKFIKGFYEK